MLLPIEITLLKSVKKGERYPLDEATRLSGLKRDSVLKAAQFLKEKGFIKIDTVVQRTVTLTGEGEKCLKEGLPEEKVLNLIKDGIDTISDLQDRIGKKEVGIALGWLKRKDIINIKEGIIKINKEEKFEEKEALTLISSGKGDSISEDILKGLLSRKLISIEEKKDIYLTVIEKPEAELRESISDLTPEHLLNGSWKGAEFLKYDVKIPSENIFSAKIHPYERIISQCRKIFFEMGFTEIKGDYVQTSFWNFDALFQPQDHPARDMQDTFYLEKLVDLDGDYLDTVRETHENGWKTGSKGWGGRWDIERAKRLVLRTHTTSLTIHHLAKNPEPPVKAFCIDRVYRRESIDATHLPEFTQLEGVVLDTDVGFKDLLGLLREFFLKMGFKDVRFRPGYFPYTEPSVEPEVYVEELGWVELGGAGIFREEVTMPLGIKGKVLAWGLGVERLAMLRLGMKDLRRLYQPDIGWLRETPITKTYMERRGH